MNYENNISKILKEERIKAGISVRNLAKMAGVSPTTICEVEKDNNTKHTFTTIAKIAKILNLDLNYLADGINKINKKEATNYLIKIKKIDDNCIEIYSENKEIILDFLNDISYETDNINLKIGEEITLEIDNIFREDDQEDFYYCPYCSQGIN